MTDKSRVKHSGVVRRTHHMLQSGFNTMHSHLIQHSHRGRHGGYIHKDVKKF